MAIKPLALKASIGLLGAGGISAVAYQGYQAFNKEEKKVIKQLSVGEKLKTEGYVLLDRETENDSHWTKILESYKNITQTEQNLKFDNFDGNDSSDRSIKGLDVLKNKCRVELTKISEDESLLKKVRKWCVTPVNVSNLLEKRGFTILKTNNNNKDEERAAWEQKISDFKVAKTTNPELGTLVTLEEGDDRLDNNVVAIKTKCKEFGTKFNYEDKFEENLANVEKWCATKPTK